MLKEASNAACIFLCASACARACGAWFFFWGRGECCWSTNEMSTGRQPPNTQDNPVQARAVAPSCSKRPAFWPSSSQHKPARHLSRARDGALVHHTRSTSSSDHHNKSIALPFAFATLAGSVPTIIPRIGHLETLHWGGHLGHLDKTPTGSTIGASSMRVSLLQIPVQKELTITNPKLVCSSLGIKDGTVLFFTNSHFKSTTKLHRL